MREIDRLIKEYNKRAEDEREIKQWSTLDDAQYFTLISREKEIIVTLKTNGVNNASISTLKFLDVGCGRGEWLQRLVFFGADPKNFYGLDLVPDRIKTAKDNCSPKMHLSAGNAECLPFPDDYFDFVFQFTVFTSILDDKIKSNIAKEMLRVLKPGGRIIWYDFPTGFRRIFPFLNYFIRCKESNYHVAPIDKAEIKKLFVGCRIKTKRVALHGKIVKLICSNWLLAMILEKFKLLTTRYLCVIKKYN